MRLSVIIPTYNEEATLPCIVKRVLRQPKVGQVIVVDDGSTDETQQSLANVDGTGTLLWLAHRCNLGKGAAIRTALSYVSEPLVAIQDADMEYDPSDLARLIDPLARNEADIVYGSRYLNRTTRLSGRLVNDAGVSVLNWSVRILYGQTLTDEATCYKVIPTSLLHAMDLRCNRFEFCPEVTAKACRLGLRILEMPIHYQPRSVAEGKKIRLRDGVHALRTLWKYRDWKGEWERSSSLSHCVTSMNPPHTKCLNIK